MVIPFASYDHPFEFCSNDPSRGVVSYFYLYNFGTSENSQIKGYLSPNISFARVLTIHDNNNSNENMGTLSKNPERRKKNS